MICKELRTKLSVSRLDRPPVFSPDLLTDCHSPSRRQPARIFLRLAAPGGTLFLTGHKFSSFHSIFHLSAEAQ